jgi:hypothetical protein
MMDIIGVKSEKGYYVKDIAQKYSPSLYGYFINGEIPEKTFHPMWFLIKSEPFKVTKFVKQPRINHRYELKPDIPWVEGSMLPKSMPKQEVMVTTEDGSCEWKEEFKHLQSLYVEVSDEQPDIETDVDFSYRTVLEIGDIKTAENFNYVVQRTQFKSDGFINIDASKIIHQEIDKIIFPGIALPNTKCSLTSEDTYKIIREHVKRNIDSRYAEVTSDYDFCFEVAKIIPLKTPYTNKTEIKNARGRSYAKPKYREYTVKNRYIKSVFEMTHSGHRYRGYTVIAGFHGENHSDLKDNIDKYLDDLMARINEPLTDCPHCNGMGIVRDV